MKPLRVTIPTKHTARIDTIRRAMERDPDEARGQIMLGDVVREAMVIGLAAMEKRIPAVTATTANDSDGRYRVTLLDHGPKKIACIKAIRELTGLGLKEAKQASEQAPITLLTTDERALANEWIRRLRETGASAAVF